MERLLVAELLFVSNSYTQVGLAYFFFFSYCFHPCLNCVIKSLPGFYLVNHVKIPFSDAFKTMNTMSNYLKMFLYRKFPPPISSDRSLANQPEG
jgi:hypothetical protein